MKMKLALTLLALAAVSINLQAATSALPAPLPEFMDQGQLAKWTAAQTAAATAATANEPSTQFYTGKPYVADAGGYVYKYRTYNPEMARWTTADPSGFPDGPNAQAYLQNPASQIDALGLFLSGTSYSGLTRDEAIWYVAKAVAGPITLEALNYADGTAALSGDQWTFSAADASSVQNSNLYQNTVYQDIQTFADANAPGAAGSLTDNNLPHYHFDASQDTDLAYALGGINFTVTGTVTFDSNNDWTYDATVTFTKLWTFSTHSATNDPHLYNRVGARLESHGYTQPYFVTGSFQDSWTEE